MSNPYSYASLFAGIQTPKTRGAFGGSPRRKDNIAARIRDNREAKKLRRLRIGVVTNPSHDLSRRNPWA